MDGRISCSWSPFSSRQSTDVGTSSKCFSHRPNNTYSVDRVMKIYTEFHLLISKNLLYCMNNKDRTVSEDDPTWVWIGFNSKWNWWMLNHIWQANYPCLCIKWIRIKWSRAHNAADTCQQQKLKWMGPEKVVSTKIPPKGSLLWTKEEHTITAQKTQTRV